MSQLSKTLEAIKEENLTKEKLEDLHSTLLRLRADVKMEMAGLMKEKALFMLREPNKSVAQRKIEWDGSEKGQRLLDLRSYVSALGDAQESVKTRIYAQL